MCMNACGHHAKSSKTNKKSSFGTLSLGNAFIATTVLTMNYTKITIQLDSTTKRFITQLRN